MIDKHELARMLGNLLQECLYAKDFLKKKEVVRRIARRAGGTLDSYEEEGSSFGVCISQVNGWGNDSLYSRKFQLLAEKAMAAE